ncbi:MAG: 50S ribosomal protein L4 [Gammaproteobacteria bacterium]|nr:50S ribosomal protein L4 [Gammaproteobacteria bacterium]NIR98741.1 50S ribosomal protein L4 [Gammaproteobacteria bacterium]NIT64451.1 50S ribosomal protein L4 [Gammaproteobacteria bacterium]NIV21371.1 50S ribosomal protein L4 [Gammaproteobacteria bacterium]NIX11241.1 50S ribosomal protein L4 [Gammaproteobacteria bacterium]
MELQLANGDGVPVSDAAFGREFKEGLIHQVVTAYLAGARAGTKSQKNRAAVRGGGAKPWRQKGTGRARAGSIRSPLWRGGGKIFAASTRDHSQKVNKKAYRAAMSSILSELARQNRLTAIASIDVENPKTKELAVTLKGLGLKRGLIVVDAGTENLYLAARNLPAVDVMDVTEINPVSLVGAERVLMTVSAVKKVEEWLG